MIFSLCVIIDQIVKFFIELNRPKVKLIPNFFEITYAENTGAIFGLAQGTNYILMLFAIIIIFIILMYMRKNVNSYSIKYKLWQLVLAGGIGNLIDRLFRGFVVDFILLKPFGIFNFADVYIVFGVGFLLLLELYDLKKEKG